MPMAQRVDPSGVTHVKLSDAIRGPEMVHHALELGALGCLARPILFDARAAILRLSGPEIVWLADVVAGMRRVHGRAPVALLADDQESYQVAARFGLLIRPHNPRYSMFRSAPEAEAWVYPGRGERRAPPPGLIGWAKLHPAHARRPLGLNPARWYPVVTQPGELESPRPGYVWLDDAGYYRQVWAGCLEIREHRADG